MAIDCKVEQERMELRLTGEIDHHRAGALMRELETQLDLESPRTVELDLGGVSFMDSSGIALLLRLYHRRKTPGGAGACPAGKSTEGGRAGAAVSH